MKITLKFLALPISLTVFFFTIFCLSELSSIELSSVKSNGTWIISDFSYYIFIAKAFWFDKINDLYTFKGLQQAILVAGGIKTNFLMPLAVSPSFFILLFPFTIVYILFGLNIAQILWTATSLSLFLSCAFFVLSKIQLSGNRWKFLLFISACLLSRTFYILGVLGQTTFFAVGCLLCYFIYLTVSHRLSKQCSAVIIAALVFCLSIKVSYLAYLMIAILIFEPIKVFIFAGGVSILSFFSLNFLLKDGWVIDYINSFKIFTAAIIPSYYREAFSFKGMNIFRSAFNSSSTQNLVSISSSLMLGLFIVVFTYCLFRKFTLKAPLRHFESNILFAMFIGGHLLFAPYLGQYEDFLLAGLGVVVFLNFQKRINNFSFFSLLGLTMIVLNFSLLANFISAPLLWACKVLYLANIMVIYLSDKKSPGVEPDILKSKAD
jgi:hypothetical protein